MKQEPVRNPVAEPAARVAGVVFILSSPRSGSTLLRAMLARHPQLFCPPELHLLPYAGMSEWRERLRLDSLGAGLQAALMELKGLDKIEAARLVEDFADQDLAVGHLYGMLKQWAGPRLLVDKSPWYAQSVETLTRAEDLFEAPRYIHLTRHPYAVIESLLRNRFDALLGAKETNPLVFAERMWATTNANLLDFLAKIETSRRHQVRFERLVQEPRDEMRALCAFLGLRYDEALLDPYEGDPACGASDLEDFTRPGTIGFGDPNFYQRVSLDASLAEAWRAYTPPRRLGGFARRIAHELEYELPSASPPAGDVAAADGGAADQRAISASLVPIQPNGDKRPLFFLAGGGGVVHQYYKLGAMMRPDQPVYALQDPGLSPDTEPFDKVEDLAAHYIRVMRSVQPKGPYYVAGWSFGGTVAFEVAQQLARAGEQVPLVILLDAHAKATGPQPAIPLAITLKAYLKNLKVGISMSRYTMPYIRDGVYLLALQVSRRRKASGHKTSFTEYFKWAWADLVRHYFLKRAEVANLVTQDSRLMMLRQPTVRKALHVLNANIQSLRAYTPRPYPGRLVLLRAHDQPFRRRFHKDPTLGWGALAEGGVEALTIPGNHVALLTKPYVDDLAARLTDCLEKAHAAEGK